MSIFKEAHLQYKDHKSNKEYHLTMESNPDGGYKVIAKFGPKDGSLTHVDKTKGEFTDWFDAARLYGKIENEKRNKGYTDMESDRDRLIKRLQKLSGIAITRNGWHRLANAVETILEEAS